VIGVSSSPTESAPAPARAPLAILHMMESSDPGGAERMLLSLLERLDPASYRSIVVTWREGWLNEQVRRLGVPVTALPLGRRLDPAWLVRCVRLMREWGIGLVHAHEFTMNVYACLLSRLTGVPAVTTVHGKGYYGERAHRRLAYRFVARASFRMVAVSRDIRRYLADDLGVRPDALETIYNGIAAAAVPEGEGRRLRRELGLAPGQPVIGTVGNLFPVKGHTYLLQAMAGLAPRHPDLVLLLVGRPLLRQQLEAEARALGVAGRVRFLGFRDDVQALLDAMDVFVLPSLSEGLSLSLLEAMAAGLPVVATAVGGNPELVREGETGYLVPPRDPAALASAIGRLLVDRASAQAFGAAGRRRVLEEFSAERMVERYEALYAEAGTAGCRRAVRAGS
jgi:glycosyltransferase involved in cell wall biosynthesis